MKYSFILFVVFFIFGSTACSSGEQAIADMNNKALTSNVEKLNISAEDQFIIDSYNERINTVDLRDNEIFQKVLKDSLIEVNKIKNDYEREKLQLNIYSALSMYKEAYELNSKMLKKYFSFSRLIHQCSLSYYAERPKAEYEKCYADLALETKKELKNPPENEVEYLALKWGYLLFMYQAGHKEYEAKLKEMLSSIEDEQLKFQLESSYELAVEQVESYKNLD